VNRADIRAEILDELATHQPAQAMRYMRKWPGGALSLVHLQVLMALETEGPLPMRALAERMDVSQASATGIVDRMEQRGLVERRREDEDRRVVRVVLTGSGQDTIGGFAAERRDRLTEILDELTDEELSGFLGGLRGMRRGRQRLHERLRAEHEASHPGSPFHDDTPAIAHAAAGSNTPDTETAR
jgi:DNA-binding MarR family transcriptional regulator